MNLKISVLVIKTNIFNNFRIFKHLKNLKKGQSLTDYERGIFRLYPHIFRYICSDFYNTLI